jgi:hypothetical protein
LRFSCLNRTKIDQSKNHQSSRGVINFLEWHILRNIWYQVHFSSHHILSWYVSMYRKLNGAPLLRKKEVPSPCMSMNNYWVSPWLSRLLM